MRIVAVALLMLGTLHAQFTVTNPSKTGPQQESIYRTLDFASARRQ